MYKCSEIFFVHWLSFEKLGKTFVFSVKFCRNTAAKIKSISGPSLLTSAPVKILIRNLFDFNRFLFP